MLGLPHTSVSRVPEQKNVKLTVISRFRFQWRRKRPLGPTAERCRTVSVLQPRLVTARQQIDKVRTKQCIMPGTVNSRNESSVSREEWAIVWA